MGETSVTSNVTVVEAAKQYGIIGRDVLDHFIPASPLVNTDIDAMKLPPIKVEPVSIEVT